MVLAHDARPSLGCLHTFTTTRDRAGVVLVSGGRLSRAAAGGGLTLFGQPPLLRVDAGHALATARAPRAGELAGSAAEVGDHLAATATGHTLPRPMGRRCLSLAIAVIARHEPITLAFRA